MVYLLLVSSVGPTERSMPFVEIRTRARTHAGSGFSPCPFQPLSASSTASWQSCRHTLSRQLHPAPWALSDSASQAEVLPCHFLSLFSTLCFVARCRLYDGNSSHLVCSALPSVPSWCSRQRASLITCAPWIPSCERADVFDTFFPSRSQRCC